MTTSAFLAESNRVAIRRPTAADREEFVARVRDSRDLHHPWLTMPETAQEYDSYPAPAEGMPRERLLVCDRETGDIAGFVNINTIVAGRFQCGSLGYGAFVPYAGRGYLSEGLRLVLRFAFDDLGLHRLEANVQPGNTASINLVKRNGFRREGYSPDFLFIDGAWRDHERWAITTEMCVG
ncbi:GNAT family N-acetyltransferase [Micromonospora zhanjiangensis]|uniref:GNAT family N-acetyltransferase n=1 Tax=Micromonospora zhanjiangensis TaxID=1522057 RepID=A0ABV8KTY8_9ACTN